MLPRSFHRPIALLLLAVCAIAAIAPGGQTLVFCLAVGDHFHLLPGHSSDENGRIEHCHDGCGHQPRTPSPAATAAVCMHDDVACDKPTCIASAGNRHGHECLDITLSAGDSPAPARKSVDVSAEVAILPPLPALIAIPIAQCAVDSPTHVIVGWSPPALLRSTILII